MNVISYSVYGTGHKYLHGFVQNILQAPAAHPGYEVHAVLGDDVGQEWIDKFRAAEDKSGVMLVLLRSGDFEIPGWPSDRIPPMFWRIMLLDHLPIGSRMLCRDCDSRFTPRESAAVREWESSGFAFHTMRDHPAHMREINGGLWGIHRVAGWPKFTPLVSEYIKSKRWKPGESDYGLDQEFLCRYVWPSARKSFLAHDEFSGGSLGTVKPFPVPEVNGQFAGEVFEVYPDGVGGFTEERRAGDINSRGR